MPRHRGKSEIVACHDEIVNLLKEGNTYISIYRILISDKKISISYPQFCYILRSRNLNRVSKIVIDKKIFEKPLLFSKELHKSQLLPHKLLSTFEDDEESSSENQDDGFGIIKKPEDEVF